jgi:hypothetical protein
VNLRIVGKALKSEEIRIVECGVIKEGVQVGC